MGTTALWQSTDQTSGHTATGAGTRRRVREFRVGSDEFALLRTGEAVIHTTLGPPPVTCQVKVLQLADQDPHRIGAGARSDCEMTVHPATEIPATEAGHHEDPASGETPDHEQQPRDPSPLGSRAMPSGGMESL